MIDVARLDADQRAGRTCMPTARRRPVDFAGRFFRAFPLLDELHRSFTEDGVLVAATTEDGIVEAYVHMPVNAEPSHLVLGRHPRCDLVLARDPAVSLRHVLLGACRVGLCELRLRLWDLRSGSRIETETGEPCEGLVTEGPLFIRLGTYAIFCLPTGVLVPLPWGDTADETWTSFPERVVQDLRRPSRLADGYRGGLGAPRATTCILPGPELLRTRPRGRPLPDEIAGHLRLRAGGERIDIQVGEAELYRGLLVGRDERCAVSAALNEVSRLHLLLVRDADATWAVDLASTNGTVVGGVALRQVRLDPTTELILAGGVSLRWVYTASGGR